jgi:hypothetical protein
MIKRTLYFGNPSYLSLTNAQMVLRLPELKKKRFLLSVGMTALYYTRKRKEEAREARLFFSPYIMQCLVIQSEAKNLFKLITAVISSVAKNLFKLITAVISSEAKNLFKLITAVIQSEAKNLFKLITAVISSVAKNLFKLITAVISSEAKYLIIANS